MKSGIAIARGMALVASFYAALCSAQAQPYPSKPIRVIIPFSAGGTADWLFRTISLEMVKTFGQPLLLENKPGAGTIIGVDAVAKSPPDGYTVGLILNSFTVNPTLVRNLPYDTLRDLQPVMVLAVAANVLVAHPSVPVAGLSELIAYARSNPGKLSYASIGNGTTSHLAGEMLKTMAGINLVHVPYKGMPAIISDLLGGQVQLFFGNLPDVLPHIRAGRLKAMGVTYPQRSPFAPDLPVIAEQGYPEFSTNSWYGMIAPAAVPKEVISRLNAEFNRVLALPEIRDAIAKRGLDVIGGSQEKAAEHIRAEIARNAKIIRDANIKLD
jgi:tripartite-type tricarboxylate transporter receptor subunit TctC